MSLQDRVIPVNSVHKLIFDIIVIFLNIIYCSIVFHALSFGSEKNKPSDEIWITFEIVVCSLYALYIVSNFFHSYQEKQTGEIITDLRKIAKHYLKTWFFFDLLSIIPYELLSNGGNDFGMFRLLSMIRIHKVFQFFTFVSRVSFKLRNTVRLVRLAFTGVFGTFLFACVWFLICKHFNKQSLEFEKTSFIQEYNMEKLDNETHGDLKKMLFSYYFVLTTLTTTGFGDYVPKSSIERLFALFIMLFGVLFFSYLMSLLSEEISSDGDHTNIQSQKLVSDLRKLKMGNEFNFFSEKVNSNILNNVHFSCNKSRVDHESKYFNFDILPFNIRLNLTQYLWCDVFTQICDYFSLLETSKPVNIFLYNLSFHFVYKEYLPSEDIIHPSFGVNELFIIQNGYVDIDNPIANLKKRLSPGDVFGDFYVLHNIKPRFRYTAVSNVELIAIDKQKFMEVSNDSPNVLKRIKHISFIKFKDLFHSLSKKNAKYGKISRERQISGYKKRWNRMSGNNDELMRNIENECKEDFVNIKKQTNKLINSDQYGLKDIDLNSAMYEPIQRSFEFEIKVMEKLAKQKERQEVIEN